eukprot:gene4663-8235_t
MNIENPTTEKVDEKKTWKQTLWKACKKYVIDTLPIISAGFIIQPLLYVNNLEVVELANSKNSVEIIQDTISNGDVTKLWSGYLVYFFKSFLTLPMSWSESIKKHYLGEHPEEIPYIKRMCLKFYTKMIPTFTNMTIQYPLTTIHTRLMVDQAGFYDGFFDCISKMWSESKFLTFFQGYSTNLVLIFSRKLIEISLREIKTIEFEFKGKRQVFYSDLVSHVLSLLMVRPLFVIVRRKMIEGMPIGNAETQKTNLEDLTLNDAYDGVITQLFTEAIYFTIFSTTWNFLHQVPEKKNDKKEENELKK